MNINPNLYPKEGFFFLEKDGARIFADTWAGVVARVIAYRTRAKYPPGDPGAEVSAQACARNPSICHEVNEAYKQQLSGASLKTRVLQWLNTVRGTEPKEFVSGDIPKNRAAYCVLCPKHTALPGGCASCSMALSEYRKQILGNRFLDGRLNECSILGEDLPVAVHLESQTVDVAELPSHCWRKRVL